MTISAGYCVKMKVSFQTSAAFLRQISLYWAENCFKKSDEFIADYTASIPEYRIFMHNYVVSY